jgi:hypothetical protein
MCQRTSTLSTIDSDCTTSGGEEKKTFDTKNTGTAKQMFHFKRVRDQNVAKIYVRFATSVRPSVHV